MNPELKRKLFELSDLLKWFEEWGYGVDGDGEEIQVSFRNDAFKDPSEYFVTARGVKGAIER